MKRPPPRAAVQRASDELDAALEEAVEALSAMGDAKLDLLPLDDEQRTAIAVYRRVKGTRNLQRKRAHIVGLLRAEGPELLEALGMGEGPGVIDGLHMELERARHALLTGGNEAVEDVLTSWPELDRQRLRQLVRAARKELDREPPHPASKKLYAYLREGAGL